MLYYKVKKFADNVHLYSRGRYHILIENELYTPAEYKKLCKVYNIDLESIYFKQVNINKNKTHWFFGARFAENKED